MRFACINIKFDKTTLFEPNTICGYGINAFY